MIRLSLERIGVASSHLGNHEIEDYVILTLTNIGTDITLDHWLEIVLTDSNNQVLYATDDLCDDSLPPPGLTFQKNSRPGLDIICVQARGLLEKGKSRVIGVKTIRSGLLDRTTQAIQYGDPLHIGDFGSLNVHEFMVTYTIVFPIDPANEFQCLQVKASNAKIITGRTATWELAPKPGEWQRVRAELAGGGLPIATILDSCLCKLLICKAESASNPRADFSSQLHELIGALKLERSIWDGLSFDNAEQAITRIRAAVRTERIELIGQAISELHKLYRDCALGSIRIRASDEVIITQEKVSQRIKKLNNGHSINMPMPDRFHETLQTLLFFCQSLRRAPNNWARDSSEKAFQDRLHQFLCDTQRDVEREVVSGPGRVDFILMNTPVELKAIPLTNEPVRIAEQHGQQAADYASLRGYGIGILLILDTQNRSAIKAHRPQLSEECRVTPFSSATGIGGVSTTLVVIITVMAFPSVSSALKPPLKPAKR